jgi:hypothetical protein
MILHIRIEWLICLVFYAYMLGWIESHLDANSDGPRWPNPIFAACWPLALVIGPSLWLVRKVLERLAALKDET